MENCIKSKIQWIKEEDRIEIHHICSLKCGVNHFLLECTIQKFFHLSMF